MGVINADPAKLRRLSKDAWKIESITMEHLSPSWRTTVLLKRDEAGLTLQSDNDKFFQYCGAYKRFCDENGDPMFRRVADLDRYQGELEVFAREFEHRKKQSFERLKAGQIRLSFVPEILIAEFLKSRNWGDSKYLPLKSEYFDIFVAIVLRSKEAADAEERLLAALPESKPYSIRIGEVLRSCFDPFKQPLKNYLRFADVSKNSFSEVAKRLLDESKLNSDMFARLSKDSPVEGQIGLRYLIDMYRRYAEWVVPLLKILTEAACALEGKAAPDPFLGMTKRVELIRQTAYSGIVDCFDPRIRHAASHGGVSYNQDLGLVKFDGLDSEGVRRFDSFELSYAEVVEKTRYFLRGFAPGMLSAFGMYEQLQLLATVCSGEYQNLLLLIGNEACD
jgi:hypothetical protein